MAADNPAAQRILRKAITPNEPSDVSNAVVQINLLEVNLTQGRCLPMHPIKRLNKTQLTEVLLHLQAVGFAELWQLLESHEFYVQ